MPHFKKALLKSYNGREVHVHIQGNPGFSSVSLFYVSSLENHPPSLQTGQTFQKAGVKKDQHMVYRPEICLAKELLKTAAYELQRMYLLIDFHWSQTDWTVVIFLTRNCSHCSSLLSAGCLNYNSLCPCYLFHKLLTLVSFSMQIHQFYSSS